MRKRRKGPGFLWNCLSDFPPGAAWIKEPLLPACLLALGRPSPWSLSFLLPNVLFQSKTLILELKVSPPKQVFTSGKAKTHNILLCHPFQRVHLALGAQQGTCMGQTEVVWIYCFQLSSALATSVAHFSSLVHSTFLAQTWKWVLKFYSLPVRKSKLQIGQSKLAGHLNKWLFFLSGLSCIANIHNFSQKIIEGKWEKLDLKRVGPFT